MKKTFLLGLLVIAQLLTGLAAFAQTTTIFDFGSSWKYLDDGSNQGTAWRSPSYSDATWNTGSGYFGYGDSWINTCLNAGCGSLCNPGGCSKRVTTYFRKTINLPNPDAFSSISFNAYRDDGIVVYVNGIEVWREHMPGGTINYNTTASNPAIGGSDETTPVSHSIPMSAFVAGDNVIAVELHQQSTSSSDCTFNMEATGVLSTDLFAFGSTWKYLDNGSDQGTGWSAPSYSDVSWASGSGYFGYGDSWINTCINAGCGSLCSPGGCSKHLTTYFRKTVNIADVAYYNAVNLSMYRDDGAVVYVNGVEVWREHMPGGTISYNTRANNPAIGGSDETTPVNRSIPISAFVTGENVIAVELHQQSPTSSDMTFNMQAELEIYVPPVPVNLTRGPYLQMGNQTATTLRWRTDVASKSRVEVGTEYGTYPFVVADATETTEHEVRVTGLTPDTKYYYRFGTDTSYLQGDTSNFFVTAPATGSPRRVTIAAYGDCGRNDNGFQTGSLSSYRSYLSSIGLKAADIMMLVGDNAYNNGTDNEYQSGFFNAYSSTILKNHMLFPAPGNHDYAQSSARQNDHNIPYYDMFTMPTAAECGGVASGTEAYYSYDWGDVHVLSLDSYGREDAGTTRLYDTLGAQVNWIKADLAATNKKWIIAYWHHPPFTKGSHNSDSEGELINIRQNFIRILERYGVDVIICGHSHDYERSYLLKDYYGSEASFNVAAHTADNSSAKYDGSANSCPYMTQSGKYNHGTVYVVSGSSGANGGVQSGYPHDAMPFSIDDGGMFFLDINENRLDAKFIRRNNTIGDAFTIMKDVAITDTVELLHGESTELSASWEGNYTWGTAGTSRAITVAPTADTVVEVKDNASGTCITDRHFVDMQCTMPDITSGPSDIARSGCDATVSYSITDTGRLTPQITYSFSGATTGSGSGTGSGSLFNIGTTNVTITATNDCGSDTHSFNVTITPLPTVFNMTGGGNYCVGGPGVSVGLSGSQAGVSYQLYDGTAMVGSPIAGTGAPVSFGTITAAASYSVLATNMTSSCTSEMSGVANVIVNPLPVVYAITGGGSYCEGGVGVAVGLSGSESGVSYQLYNGGSSVGAAVSGTSVPMTLGSYTASGTYTVLATNASTSCARPFPGSVSVSVIPLVTPMVTLSSTTASPVCSGNTMSFITTTINGGSTPSYIWSVNGSVMASGSADIFSYAPANEDTVSVRLNSSETCVTAATSIDDSIISVLPNVMPSADISVSPGDSVCEGSDVIFNVATTNGGSSPSYTWLINSTMSGSADTLAYSPAHGDVILLSMASNAPCRLADNVYSNVISMKVDESYIPVVGISASPGLFIAEGQPVTFTAYATSAGDAPTYQWSINGSAVPGATLGSFTSSGFANKDTVSCMVTASGLCGNETTNSVIMKVASLGTTTFNDLVDKIRVVPNPTTGMLTVEGSLENVADGTADIVVTNILGQKVYTGSTTVVSGVLHGQIMLGNGLANGMYLITVRTDVGSTTFHIVLKR